MIYLQIGLGLLLFFFLATMVLFIKNNSLKKEIKELKKTVKEQTLSILNAESETTQNTEVPISFSLSDEVMMLAEAGESREHIADKLNVPVSKVDLIIKFDKIKKEHIV